MVFPGAVHRVREGVVILMAGFMFEIDVLAKDYVEAKTNQDRDDVHKAMCRLGYNKREWKDALALAKKGGG